jgi:hypothetical protein
MPITLNNFEKFVSRKILDRGLDYFYSGHIKKTNEISPGNFESIVRGTQDYTVRIRMINNAVTNHFCNCPYDQGGMCKHIVAVLYYFQEEYLSSNSNLPEKQKDSELDKIEHILSKISFDELKNFIIKEALSDNKLRNSLYLAFSNLHETEYLDSYKEEIESFIDSKMSAYGFLDYDETIDVYDYVYDILENAEHHAENKNYRIAYILSFAIMESIVGFIDHSDYHEVSLYDLVEESFELLQEISEDDLDDKLRKDIFNHTIESFKDGIFINSDWYSPILELAFLNAISEEDYNTLFNIIDDASFGLYNQEIAIDLKYRIVLKTKGDESASTFLEENLSFSNIRNKAIEYAFKKGDFGKAKAYAYDGIEQHKKAKPGLVNDWNDWLLKIAVEENDTEKVIELAKSLLLSRIGSKKDYFKILKKFTRKDEWEFFFSELIDDIEKKDSHYSFDLIAKLLIREGKWNDLFEHVSKNPDLYVLNTYEKHLKRDYAPELAGMYADAIDDYLKYNMGRNYYQTACDFIRCIYKLDQKKVADTLIEQLTNKYPRRRALIEELKGIKKIL